MNFDFQNKLFQRFPNLFIERSLPMTQTSMCWGIETGNGWFDIIWNLCENLEKFKGLRFSQVKEKFKSLRIYFQYDPKIPLRGLNARQRRNIKRQYKMIEYLIREAEKRSFKTCEICGNALGLELDRNDFWITKDCENCNK